jgi:hypothetical protein
MTRAAIGFFAALDATAAVARAQVTEGRARAFLVFVALITDQAPFVAAVGTARTIAVDRARLQAAIGQCVAGEAGRTVLAGQARDTAVS